MTGMAGGRMNTAITITPMRSPTSSLTNKVIRVSVKETGNRLKISSKSNLGQVTTLNKNSRNSLSNPKYNKQSPKILLN